MLKVSCKTKFKTQFILPNSVRKKYLQDKMLLTKESSCFQNVIEVDISVSNRSISIVVFSQFFSLFQVLLYFRDGSLHTKCFRLQLQIFAIGSSNVMSHFTLMKVITANNKNDNKSKQAWVITKRKLYQQRCLWESKTFDMIFVLFYTSLRTI